MNKTLFLHGSKVFLSKLANKNSLKQSNFNAIFMAWETMASCSGRNEIAGVIGKKG